MFFILYPPCLLWFVVSYLWGIETFFWDYFYRGITSCILPMRNWNNLLFFWSSTWAWLFVVSYLWGIETPGIEDIYTHCHKNEPLYLTYEELKHNIFADQVIPALRCILPMRNWNVTFSNRWRSSRIQLYLTYEELKHHASNQ